MTCIIGLIDEEKNIWMGGDSASTSDCNVIINKKPKIFIKDNFVFGISGSPRLTDILKYKFEPPETNCGDPLCYLSNDFVDALRECLKESGFIKTDEDGVENIPDSYFLLGYKGRLFKIYHNFQVEERVENYNVIGCAEDIALGSMWTTDKSEIRNPKTRISIALTAAQKFNTCVREPFVILKLEYKGE